MKKEADAIAETFAEKAEALIKEAEALKKEDKAIKKEAETIVEIFFDKEIDNAVKAVM